MQYFKVKNKTDMMIAYDPDSNVVYELEETSVYLGQLAILPILQGSTLTGGGKTGKKKLREKS